MAMALTLYTMALMCFSPKTVLLRLSVISTSLGCLHLPGLSWAAGGVCLTGVKLFRACEATAKDDMMR